MFAITIERKVGGKIRQFPVVREPVPHIVVNSRKDFTQLLPHFTECAPHLLVNPYNGCHVSCFFCYARGLPGYFEGCERDGCVAVFPGIERNIEKRLGRLKQFYPVQVCPSTDPFQPVNARYELTEKILHILTRFGLPARVLSKGRYSDTAIRLLAQAPYHSGQVTILTPREEVRRRLMRVGATTEELLGNLERLSRAGVYSVLRLDPIVPGLTDDLDDLRKVIRMAKEAGARHVIVSVMRIPRRIAKRVFADFARLGIKTDFVRGLFSEYCQGSLQAKWNYRRPLFDELSAEAKRQDMTFSLCCQFKREAGHWAGLNRQYCTAKSCTGNVPEKGEKSEYTFALPE